MKAVGIHVFAGGFTFGVRAAGYDVTTQLEVHDLGTETCEANRIHRTQRPASEWPRIKKGRGYDTHDSSMDAIKIIDLNDVVPARPSAKIWESLQLR